MGLVTNLERTDRSPGLVKNLVKAVLSSPYDLEWQVQGLGMLRTYLSDEWRMHVWDERLKFKDVSEIHTHPWNFRSYVVAGVVRNFKLEYHHLGADYYRQTIKCGVGGGLVDRPETVRLMMLHPDEYKEGDSYQEEAEEIHFSVPSDGTVTIVKREFLEDVDHAYVFWRTGEWGSAEPREATREEVTMTCSYALNTWF